MRHSSLRIDYDEMEPTSYRGVTIRHPDGTETAWRSGDPVRDWADMLSWRGKEGAAFAVLETSSLTHFVQDVPGYRFLIRDGVEVLVRDPQVDAEPDSPGS